MLRLLALLTFVGMLALSTHALNDRDLIRELDEDTLDLQEEEVSQTNFSSIEVKNFSRISRMKIS